jgi:hypothetical protein
LETFERDTYTIVAKLIAMGDICLQTKNNKHPRAPEENAR